MWQKNIKFILIIWLIFFVFYGCSTKKESLYNAITKNNITRVKNLIETNNELLNSICKECNISGTPLMIAVISRNEEIVEFFLKNGADPNKKNSKGFFPLYWAASKNINIINLLYIHGANVNQTLPNGFTPLMKAAGWNNIQVVNFLIRMNADITLRDNEGRTALFFAVKSLDGFDSLELLLKNGANLETRNNNGETVLEYAERINIDNSFADAIKILKRYKKNGAGKKQ